MASRQGLEPRPTVLETVMLPLHQRDIWYPWTISKCRPTPYQDGALPLSYKGKMDRPERFELPTS